jgi:hypothetical protein
MGFYSASASASAAVRFDVFGHPTASENCPTRSSERSLNQFKSPHDKVRDRKFSITSALNIAPHREGATPNDRVACGLVIGAPAVLGSVRGLAAAVRPVVRSQCDHGSLISWGTSLDEGRGEGWRTPARWWQSQESVSPDSTPFLGASTNDTMSEISGRRRDSRHRSRVAEMKDLAPRDRPNCQRTPPVEI